MIEGAVRETGTPTLRLKVIGRGGSEVTVEGILDTGFDGFLCLPVPFAVSLGLELIDVTRTELADGTVMENESDTPGIAGGLMSRAASKAVTRVGYP